MGPQGRKSNSHQWAVLLCAQGVRLASRSVLGLPWTSYLLKRCPVRPSSLKVSGVGAWGWAADQRVARSCSSSSKCCGAKVMSSSSSSRSSGSSTIGSSSGSNGSNKRSRSSSNGSNKRSRSSSNGSNKRSRSSSSSSSTSTSSSRDGSDNSRSSSNSTGKVDIISSSRSRSTSSRVTKLLLDPSRRVTTFIEVYLMSHQSCSKRWCASELRYSSNPILYMVNVCCCDTLREQACKICLACCAGQASLTIGAWSFA